MSDNIGYIGLWRKIRDHWTWTESLPASQALAWIDMLLEARFSKEPKKVMIKGNILFCNYGESLRSLESWGKRWGWHKSKVKRFFSLLKKDGNIETVNETVTTRVSICNYDKYDVKNQNSDTVSDTESKRERNGSETGATPKEECIKNEKNVKKEEEVYKETPAKKPEPKQSSLLEEIPDDVKEFVDRFNKYVIKVKGSPMEKMEFQYRECINIMKNRDIKITEMNEILEYIDNEKCFWYGKLTSMKSMNLRVKSGEWRPKYILIQARTEKNRPKTEAEKMAERFAETNKEDIYINPKNIG